MSTFKFPLGITPPLLYHIYRVGAVFPYTRIYTPRGALCVSLFVLLYMPIWADVPPNPFRLEHQSRLQPPHPLAQFSKYSFCLALCHF